jgi:hypothetical protein
MTLLFRDAAAIIGQFGHSDLTSRCPIVALCSLWGYSGRNEIQLWGTDRELPESLYCWGR